MRSCAGCSNPSSRRPDPAMPFDPRGLVDPAFFSRLDSIELRARALVEGSMHGLHRSSYLGMSVEFASHREYTPGDDLRHVNWKLYARYDRLYIKEYDADTNLNLYLLVDCSASMGCANTGRSKLQYAAALAGALAHRRGIAVVLSDLFGDLPALVGGLDHLRYLNHEVILSHILAPWERDHP